jgi:hypothetical protein
MQGWQTCSVKNLILRNSKKWKPDDKPGRIFYGRLWFKNGYYDDDDDDYDDDDVSVYIHTEENTYIKQVINNLETEENIEYIWWYVNYSFHFNTVQYNTHSKHDKEYFARLFQTSRPLY